MKAGEGAGVTQGLPAHRALSTTVKRTERGSERRSLGGLDDPPLPVKDALRELRLESRVSFSFCVTGIVGAREE